jgi:L-histidine Nalpha-methyltransferase
VEVHLGRDEVVQALRDDARAGLTASPRWMRPKWLYDERGSELFDRITRLPEYYPTRTERAILLERAGEIVRLTGADTLVELGSGTSEKTRILLEALDAAGLLRRFEALDVSEQTLRDAAFAILASHPGITVRAVVGDFERHLPLLAGHGVRLVVFLGGTIGNLLPDERALLLRGVRQILGARDAFLLGVDLVKDPAEIDAAYNDSQGLTAEFNLNLLLILNRELGADFDLAGFEHREVYDTVHEWVELSLVSRREQHVRVAALDLELDFAAGEAIYTEISARFRPQGITAELAAAGLRVVQMWTDSGGAFALTLAVPDDLSPGSA